jgi:adhesin/invasin
MFRSGLAGFAGEGHLGTGYLRPMTDRDPRRFPALPWLTPISRGWAVAWVVAVTAVTTTCTDQTGPGRLLVGAVSLAPRFVADAAGIVPVSQGRFVLTRPADGTVALDTVVPIAPGADSVDLALQVRVESAGEQFLLRIALIGPAPANDTVFRAGPLVVTPTTTGAPVPVDVPLVYSGVGADAASVEIARPAETLVAGVPVTLTAVARDSAGQPIAGTPVAWRSLDPLVAAVPDAAVGTVLGAARGTARIVADLLTGPADTALVNVILPPAAIAADSGSGQTGPAAGLLQEPLVARVTASDGVGVPDVWVRFAVTLGGGSLSADSVLTDQNGRARVEWTLGDLVGSQTVTATTAALPAASAVFSATSQATGPGAVAITAGNDQSALVGTAVPTAPQVRVTDVQNNPVPGVEVVFAVTQGGGGIVGSPAATDANGLATLGSWTLGAAVGLNALTATVSGLTPVQFLALATSTGGVTSMILEAGDGQTALANTAVAVAPSVRLTDTAGAPVAGVAVPFTIGGGGTVTDTTPASDANGIASVGAWVLGLPGANTLTATLPGLPAVTFTATATVGEPAQLLIVSGNGQSAEAGTGLPQPLVVEVRDSAGNPVPGVTVDWITLDGAIAPAAGTTDAAGQAQATWTLSTNRITQTATASVTGLTPAVFTATAIFPNPSILLALVGTDRVRVGSSVPLEVTLTAPAGGNGVFVSVVSGNPAVLEVDTTTGGGVFIPTDGTTGQVLVTGVAGGTATLTATASGYANGVLSVPVSVQVLSMPGTLNVPFGSTASLPLQISTPAPAGGVTVTLVSSDATRVAVTTPSVTILEGQQTANATVSGVFPGTATVTGTTADYGSAQSVVSATANLNIVQSTLTINASFGDPVTIELRSGGVIIPAPAPGVEVTLTPRNTGCVAAVSPVTIPAGLVNVTSAISYGGFTAGFPCTSWVVAEAPDIQPDSVNVTVNAAPGITSSATTVGAGLQENVGATLGASNHGGVNVVVRSTNPQVALVAPNASTPGTDSIVVAVADGSTGVPYYLQGVEGVADTVSFAISAPGFTTREVRHTVAVPQLDLSGVSTALTTLSPDDVFTVRVGIGNGANLTVLQEVRAGGTPLTATVVSDTAAVARLVTATDTGAVVTVQIPVLANASPSSVAGGGVAQEPLTAGVTVLRASIPGVVTTTTGGVRTVTVTQPGISSGATTVGAGLQENVGATLGASDHGGVNVVVRSTNPQVALVAPNASTPGTDSIVVAVADGSTGVPYHLQGLEGVADTVSFVISAPGFTTREVRHTVVVPQLDLSGVSTALTTLSPDDVFTVRVGIGNGANLTVLQEIRAGGTPLTATVVSDTAAVARLVTATDTGAVVTVQIPVLANASPSSVAGGGVAQEPLTAGVTVLRASIPGVVTTTTGGVRTVTVTQPGISSGATTVGAGLQENVGATLGASDHGGVSVVVRSTNPQVALVAPNASTPGTDSIVVAVANGSTGVPYHLQGVEGVADTVSFVISAPGFTTREVRHTVAVPQLDIAGLSTSITTLSADDVFQVRVGIGNGANLTVLQEIRAGGTPLTATVTSSAPTVGQLATSALRSGTVEVQIPVLTSVSASTVAGGGVAFDPLTAGSTTVSATIPGFVTTTTGGIRTVTVTTPALSVVSVTVGAGLQESTALTVGANDYGSATVVIKSSNPQVALVSPNATTAGSDSIVITVNEPTTSVGFFVHGLEGQTGTVTISARADGFTDGSNTATVVQPALDISGLTLTTTAGAADDPFQVRVGTGTSASLNALQEARAGGPGLTVTVTSSAPEFGQLVTTSLTSGTVTVNIAAGFSVTPSTVAGGGVAFDAVAAGTTTVSASISGFVTTANGARTVTINP